MTALVLRSSFRHANRHPHCTDPRLPYSPLLQRILTPSDRYLVALAGQVIGKGLDGGSSVAGDVLLTVVADDDGLLGLGDSDAQSALLYQFLSVFVQKSTIRGGCSYGSCVDTSILGPGHDVSAARDEETFGEGFILGGFVAANNARDGLHLLRLELHGEGQPCR